MNSETPPTGKLPRAQRREQLLDAATPLFARNGYAATSFDLVAEAAGVSRVILYRHFDSKAELFRDAMAAAARRLTATEGHDVTGSRVETLLTWASHNPAGFRLLFHQAAREPRFRPEFDALRDDLTAAVYRRLTAEIPDERWARWASRLSLVITVEAVMAWLDVGGPDPELAAARIEATVAAMLAATGR